VKAARLRPKTPPYVPLPQCCVTVPDCTHWAPWYAERRKIKLEAHGWSANCCTRSGTVEIDGKPYCGQHGGQVALAALLGEEPDFT
jgi:hypothetical protein